MDICEDSEFDAVSRVAQTKNTAADTGGNSSGDGSGNEYDLDAAADLFGSGEDEEDEDYDDDGEDVEDDDEDGEYGEDTENPGDEHAADTAMPEATTSPGTTRKQSARDRITFNITDEQATQLQQNFRAPGDTTSSGAGADAGAFATSMDVEYASVEEVLRDVDDFETNRFSDDNVRYRDPRFCYLCFAAPTPMSDTTFHIKLCEMLNKRFGRVQVECLALHAQRFYNENIRSRVPGKPAWPQRNIIKHITDHSPTTYASNWQCKRMTDAMMKVLGNGCVFIRTDSGLSIDPANAQLLLKVMELGRKINAQIDLSST